MAVRLGSSLEFLSNLKQYGIYQVYKSSRPPGLCAGPKLSYRSPFRPSVREFFDREANIDAPSQQEHSLLFRQRPQRILSQRSTLLSHLSEPETLWRRRRQSKTLQRHLPFDHVRNIISKPWSLSIFRLWPGVGRICVIWIFRQDTQNTRDSL